MLSNRISRNAGRWLIAALVAWMAFAPAARVSAGDRTHRLQGLFCNTEAQIDETLARMHRGLPPRVAVELTNDDAVVCTFVDLLHYVVDRPVVIKELRGAFPLFKYQGQLVGVVVGGVVRPVTPAVPVFFVTPERLADARLEGRA